MVGGTCRLKGTILSRHICFEVHFNIYNIKQHIYVYTDIPI